MSIEEPKVYLATYSNTDVYESTINNCPLMRRCKDDWVNATQILKCCNFPKAKRTKILEKGVQQGRHQKIQGGYGRFQGTWVPLPDAQQLAATYGLTPDMAPVLFFDPTKPEFEISRKERELNKDGTPVKRKYVKKKKPEETPSKKPKTEPYTDYAAMDSFASRSSSQMPQMGQVQMPYMPNGNMQYTQDYVPVSNNNMNNYPPMGTEYHNYSAPPQQMQVPSQPQFQPQNNGNYQYHYPPSVPQNMGQFHHVKGPSSQSTNETNWSQEENTKDSDTSMSSNEDANRLNKGEPYGAQLLRFFSEDKCPIPYFIENPPYDFNINEAIDDEGHTPLHWAASIGHYNMIHILLAKGANPLVVNNFGLNPLSKLISFNNCFELKNFPKVLDDLEVCLVNTDINGRTPLHYLCQFAKLESKYESLRYYIGAILNKLTSLTNSNLGNKSVNLLKTVVDHQDVNGDTCLHLAARSKCGKIVKLLLSYNARDDLVNINQETSKSIIMTYDLLGSSSEIPNARLLATPIQQRPQRMETPDTQRTTVQDDDDDDSHQTARVNTEQLNQLLKGSGEDNKENIFLDSMKVNMSTPNSAYKTHSFTSSTSQQPLAVISERTSESTPMEVNENHDQMKKSPPLVQSYSIDPPQLDSDGDLKLEDTISFSKLSSQDMTGLFSTMIKSLSSSYKDQVQESSDRIGHLRTSLKQKTSINNSILESVSNHLVELNIDQFKSLVDAKTNLEAYVDTKDVELQNIQNQTTRSLEKNQAFQLATLVEEKESQLKNPEDNGSAKGKLQLAIELSELQVQRTKLLNDLTNKTKLHGVDDKMYKYRKLISLSCGLKVEEIDGLIDAIEESLMETAK